MSTVQSQEQTAMGKGLLVSYTLVMPRKGWGSPRWSQRAIFTVLLLSSDLYRFPTLKMFLAETRPGRVPFWVESADLWFEWHHGWAEALLGFKPLKRRLSEYTREHIYWSIQYERLAIELRHHVGVDRIMFTTEQRACE
jgi:hypothetical protein